MLHSESTTPLPARARARFHHTTAIGIGWVVGSLPGFIPLLLGPATTSLNDALSTPALGIILALGCSVTLAVVATSLRQLAPTLPRTAVLLLAIPTTMLLLTVLVAAIASLSDGNSAPSFTTQLLFAGLYGGPVLLHACLGYAISVAMRPRGKWAETFVLCGGTILLTLVAVWILAPR